MHLRTPLLLSMAGLIACGCGDTTAPRGSAEIVVLSSTRVLYADGFPAIVFTVENRGAVGIEAVNIDVDAIREDRTVASAVTQISDLTPGEQAESDPAVFATLDTHADYECYRYRVRSYDDRGQVLSDDTSGKVCS